MTPQQLDRFLAKLRFVDLDEDLGECWIWTAARLTNGYGVLGVATGTRLAHRLAYEHWVGAIPDRQEVDHLCRNRACVNPRHLEPVRHRDNALRGFWSKEAREQQRVKCTGLTRSPESRERYRAAKIRLGRKAACKRGHPFTAENTHLQTRRDGGVVQVCRLCKRDAQRVIRARQKAEAA